MICYLDTSALVKLYVHEQGSETVRKLVDAASVVATSKVAYPEARAALARGFREGLLAEKDYRVPRRGGPPVPVSVFSLRSEHLADYAAYLEEQGKGPRPRASGR